MSKQAPKGPPMGTYRLATGPNPDGLNHAAVAAQKPKDEKAPAPAVPADEKEN